MAVTSPGVSQGLGIQPWIWGVRSPAAPGSTRARSHGGALPPVGTQLGWSQTFFLSLANTGVRDSALRFQRLLTLPLSCRRHAWGEYHGTGRRAGWERVFTACHNTVNTLFCTTCRQGSPLSPLRIPSCLLAPSPGCVCRCTEPGAECHTSGRLPMTALRLAGCSCSAHILPLTHGCGMYQWRVPCDS